MPSLDRIARLLQDTRRGVPVAAALLLVIGVGYVDYWTGWEASVGPFYLVPIALVAWLEARSSAVGFSLFCGVVWFAIDRLSGHVYSTAAMQYWNGSMQLGFFLVVALTLSSLRKSYEREKALARADALTGLSNRRSFEEVTALEIRRALRYRRPMALAYVDIDDFKIVNDRFGHAAGDGVLLLVSESIRRNIRTTDSPGRMGGDEFAVLLPETGLTEARAVVEKLLADLKATAGEGLAPVTVSVGVACFRVPPETPRQLIEKADALMYLVKRRGKNGVEFALLGEERLEAVQ
jgi:diguanylate cyclase (GGDEF)-like protein